VAARFIDSADRTSELHIAPAIANHSFSSRSCWEVCNYVLPFSVAGRGTRKNAKRAVKYVLRKLPAKTNGNKIKNCAGEGLWQKPIMTQKPTATIATGTNASKSSPGQPVAECPPHAGHW